MPSDTPPIRKAPPASPAGGSPPAGDRIGPAQAGETGQPPVPTILHPSLRRYWVREEPADEQPKPMRRQLLTQSIYWTVAVGVMVGAVIVFEGNLRTIEAPRQETANAPAAGPGIPDDTPLPVVTARAEVVGAYGRGAITRVEQQAQSVGAAVEQAVLCGRQSRPWALQVRATLAEEVTDQIPSFDEDTKTQVWMQEFAAAQFNLGQALGTRNLVARGKDAACEELPRSPGYSRAEQLARVAAANAREQESRRQLQIEQAQREEIEQAQRPDRPRIRD